MTANILCIDGLVCVGVSRCARGVGIGMGGVGLRLGVGWGREWMDGWKLVG